ncbi:hypothetical protein L5515_005367 [Caenorhabditis briggsae]|uniref:Uncharacterized protein n=1 Tax=Caenorhabditis briggsae TaxID=6238 RepID=A0AAE9EN49_CAEBR|nr:hypothetical protein L5515_005367 [Caenorhabditis briggsae]
MFCKQMRSNENSETTFPAILTIEVLIGYVMCIVFIVQCSKKKQEKSAVPRGSKSKHLLVTTTVDESIAANVAENQKNPPEVNKSGKDALKSGSKVKSVDSGPGGKKSKMNRASKRKSDKSSSSAMKDSKPMDGTQNGPTPNDPTGNNSAKENEISIINADECGPMEETINDPETPVIHDRVVRTAATDMIFDPKLVTYKGNLDVEKDQKEIDDLEKEMMKACQKHETKFKDVRKNDEKNRFSKLPESEKSTEKQTPIPKDLRVKMRPDQCLLFETKDQQTEDDMEYDTPQNNDANTEKK